MCDVTEKVGDTRVCPGACLEVVSVHLRCEFFSFFSRNDTVFMFVDFVCDEINVVNMRCLQELDFPELGLSDCIAICDIVNNDDDIRRILAQLDWSLK